MMAFAYYLLKVIVCSGILFLYYHAFLRNRLFHKWNRFFLLMAVVLSLCLPLLSFNLSAPQQSAPDVLNYLLFVQSADQYMEEFTIYYQPDFTTEDWLAIGYAAVSGALFIALGLSLYRIARLVQRHASSVFNDFVLLSTKEPGSPFSFLHYIFWNDDILLNSPSGQQIFQHELVHVKEKHTWDKLFMQVVLVFFWCNPFFWLVRKELRFIHEFIADQKAVGSDADAFAKMILHASYPTHFDAIRNPFFQSSIKRRLQMLTQLKNPKAAYVARLAALPLTAMVVFAFTVKTSKVPPASLSLQHENVAIGDTIPKKQDIRAIDVRKNKEKNINEIEIHYKNGKSEVLTEREATARGLINNDYSNQKLDSSRSSSSSFTFRGTGPTPLFVLDGKEVSREEVMKLNPKAVQTINVLKANSATAVYGEKGKNGVVEIKTKPLPSGEPLSFQENGQEVLKGNVTKLQVSEGDDMKIEADEVTVVGRKMNKNETTTVKGEVTVYGYGKQSGNDEMRFTGDSLAVQPVFEKTEFAPSIDPVEWRRFLEKYTQSFIEEIGKKAPSGTYTVNVRFIVEKDGSLSNVSILNDPGYGMGSKLLEMMKHAPKWKPAIQNERVVRSYHVQPITFVIGGRNKETITIRSAKPGVLYLGIENLLTVEGRI